jgi:hypothetical protein
LVEILTSPEDSRRFHPSSHDRTCPSCGQLDRVERASGIVRRTSGIIFESDAPFVSELARALAPPQPPHEVSLQTVLSWLIGGWLAALLLMLALSAAGRQDAVEIPDGLIELATVTTIAFAIFLPLFLLARYYNNHWRLRTEMPAWQNAMNRWHSVYYCYRDDVVFVAGEDVAVQPEHAQRLIYEGGPRLYTPRDGR